MSEYHASRESYFSTRLATEARDQINLSLHVVFGIGGMELVSGYFFRGAIQCKLGSMIRIPCFVVFHVSFLCQKTPLLF